MRPGASLAGSRKVPVQTSPCQSEKTMVESPAWAETPILRTEPLVSKNQVRSPNKWPSTGTKTIMAPVPILGYWHPWSGMMPLAPAGTVRSK
jgi:hypothetical protein